MGVVAITSPTADAEIGDATTITIKEPLWFDIV